MGTLDSLTQPAEKEPWKSHLADLLIFQRINQDKSLGIFLHWMSPPVFNVRKYQRKAASQWSLEPHPWDTLGRVFLPQG